MIKKYNWVIIFFLSISLTGNALSENNFFLEAKKIMTQKNMINQSFYFKEILFLTQRMKAHIYTWRKSMKMKKMKKKKNKISIQCFYSTQKMRKRYLC